MRPKAYSQRRFYPLNVSKSGAGAAMRIYRHWREVPAEGRGAVVAIGNFDGVHLGHQAVISDARRIAREAGAPLAVLNILLVASSNVCVSTWASIDKGR